jgi:hypothetical protein
VKKPTSLLLSLFLAAGPLALSSAALAQPEPGSDSATSAAPSSEQPAQPGNISPPDSGTPPPAAPLGEGAPATPPTGESPAPAAAAPVDPPSRVARLNYINGSITVQPAGASDWMDANPNRPMTTGDHIWTDQNSRGELHVGSTAIRLSSQVGASILNLTDQVTQIQLAQGAMSVRIRNLAPDETFEIDAPNLAFTPRTPGEYRIEVDPSGGATTVTVRAGTGEVSGSGGGPFPLQFNRQYAISGPLAAAPAEQPAPPRDGFDQWVAQRTRREEQAASARYVSRDTIGYDDLDEHGYWRHDPVYGNVWWPNGVAVGWAPYHQGHWAYVSPWGWNWVADEPWGFAPYHYGRWVQAGGGWGWVPGPMGPRPMYAPALVGWVGGAGFGATVSLGGVQGVAWFPLGPRDVWVPPYRTSPTYVQNVNVYNTRGVNVVQVNNYYGNYQRNPGFAGGGMYSRAPGAVTAVPTSAFVGGQAVGHSFVRMSPEQLNHPVMFHGGPGAGGGGVFAPPRQGFIPGAAHASGIRPPAALGNRPVFTRMAPPPNASAFGNSRPLNPGGRFGAEGGARPGQAFGGAHPGQNPVEGGARPGQAPMGGVRPGQIPAAGGVRPGQAPAGGVRPAQAPVGGARPGPAKSAPQKTAPKKPAPRKKPAPKRPLGREEERRR